MTWLGSTFCPVHRCCCNSESILLIILWLFALASLWLACKVDVTNCNSLGPIYYLYRALTIMDRTRYDFTTLSLGFEKTLPPPVTSIANYGVSAWTQLPETPGEKEKGLELRERRADTRTLAAVHLCAYYRKTFDTFCFYPRNGDSAPTRGFLTTLGTYKHTDMHQHTFTRATNTRWYLHFSLIKHINKNRTH